MIKYENDCVRCPQGCGHCGARHTPHYYCDMCGEESDELYWLDNKQVCEYCLLHELKIKEDEYV